MTISTAIRLVQKYFGIALLLVLPMSGATGAEIEAVAGFPDTIVEGANTVHPVYISGSSDETRNVDVHVGLIAPDGTIYEYPDWNTNLDPWLHDMVLPAGFSYPPTVTFDARDVPGGLTPGTWQVAAALTEPGTTNFIHVSTASFTVLDDEASDNGFRLGALLLQQDNNNDGFSLISLSARAFFYESSDNTFQDTGTIDECNIVESQTDDPKFLTDDPKFLNAGDFIQLSGPGFAVDLFNTNFGSYLTNGFGSIEPSFYHAGETYRFQGFGGSDVGAFVVDITAPQLLSLFTPAEGVGGTLYQHPASSDLQVNWSNNSDGVGDVIARLAGETETIFCKFLDDGFATIPGTLISEVKNRGDNSIVTLSVSREENVEFNTDGGSLDVGFAVISSSVDVGIELQ